MTLGDDLMARLDHLATFSSSPDGLTRLFLTPEHRAAAEQVLAWMAEAGMTAGVDAIGNVVGRYDSDPPGRPALLLGSHIDTVRDAGKYDGNLGVLAALAAVAELHRAGERLPFAIEVLAFGDEEGVRFPSTLAGSRAIAGRFDAATLAGADADGIRLADALLAFGGDPAGIAGLARQPEAVLGYVELHIEQGPVLESEGLPIGVVTAINGASRFAIDFAGLAGHAGTVPMNGRRDALAGAAALVLAIEARALAGTAAGLVATVGQLEPRPGAVNVIPGQARLTLDIRAPDDAVRLAAVADIQAEARRIAQVRGLMVEMTRSHDQPAVACAPWLIEQLAAAIERVGVTPRRLPSGAGHDAMAVADLCPIGMLFLRCAGGISHNPAEAITAADADVAIRVLLDFFRHFRPEQS